MNNPLAIVQQRFAQFLIARLPTLRRTIIREQTAQTFLAPDLDVDTVRMILDGTDVGDTDEYFRLCEYILLSDAHLQGEIAKRKLAVLSNPITVVPVDDKNDDDIRAAKIVTDAVLPNPSFLPACAALLDGCIWPLAVVEKVFRPSAVPGLQYELEQLVRVPPRLFNYSISGYLRVWDTDRATGHVLGTTHDPDPTRYIVHRGHLLSTPDFRGGPMRSLVFWSLFSGYDRDWWARFLDRYGSPFMVGKYDQADDESRRILESAFSLASRLGGIVITRQTDVELKEAMSKSGGEGYDMFLKVCQREKSKLIVGQTTSAEAEHAGLGGAGVAKAQEQVRSDIRQWDAMSLGDTLQHQLFEPFLQVNGTPGHIGVHWGGEEPQNLVDLSAAIASLNNAGLEVDDQGLSSLSDAIGYPLRRKAMPAPQPVFGQPPATKALAANPPPAKADAANASIARTTAPKLARSFSGVFAPVAQIIRESSSADELTQKIEETYAGWRPESVSLLVQEALAAFSSNGLS